MVMENGILVLIAFTSGWLVAQVAKMVFAIVTAKGKLSTEKKLEYLVKSGGMPSGHAASFTAATLVIGIVMGFNTVMFALSLCTSIIIIYDAINVRYAVGEQGKILNALLEYHEHKNRDRKSLKVVEGHTLSQVVAGVFLGAFLALVVTKIANFW